MDTFRSRQELDTSCHQLLLGIRQVSLAVLDHPKVLLLGRAKDGLHELVGHEVGLALRVLSMKHNTLHPHSRLEEVHLEIVLVDVGIQLLDHLWPGHLRGIT